MGMPVLMTGSQSLIPESVQWDIRGWDRPSPSMAAHTGCAEPTLVPCTCRGNGYWGDSRVNPPTACSTTGGMQHYRGHAALPGACSTTGGMQHYRGHDGATTAVQTILQGSLGSLPP